MTKTDNPKNTENPEEIEDESTPEQEAAPPDEADDLTELEDTEGIEDLEALDGVESPAPDDADTPEDPAEVADVMDIDFGRSDDADEELEALPSEVEEETADIEEVGEGEAPDTPSELKASVECLLFTTPSPLSPQRLKKLLGKIDMRTLRGVLVQLQAEYEARDSGLQILEGAEGYQMCTRAQYADVILKLHRQRKRNPLSQTALETLAIVAYKQPLTRAEVEMIRGVESSGVLRNLCDMGLIKVVGRKDVIGRPQIYGTTSTFLRTFGLKSLAELPTIQNLRRQFGAMALPKRETRPDEPELPFDDPEIAATTASDEQADGQENDEAAVPEEDTSEAGDASGDDAPEVGDVPEAATPEADAVEVAEPSDGSVEAVAEDESPEDQS